jgi:hypothetical protein
MRGGAEGLRRLVRASTQRRTVYLVATRHQPRTYFGCAGGADCTSHLYAFDAHDLAMDVARGLECAKRRDGAYPPLFAPEVVLHVTDPRDNPRDNPHDLDVIPTTVRDIMHLVDGSGLGVCFMSRPTGNDDDGNDGDDDDGACLDTIDVPPRPGGPTRVWLAAQLPATRGVGAGAGAGARDPVTDPRNNAVPFGPLVALTEAVDRVAHMLLAVLLLLLARCL